MPSSVSGRTVLMHGRGVRQIDEQFLYSAAWLDDPYPEVGQIRWVGVLDPAAPARASTVTRPALPQTDAPAPALPGC